MSSLVIFLLIYFAFVIATICGVLYFFVYCKKYFSAFYTKTHNVVKRILLGIIYTLLVLPFAFGGYLFANGGHADLAVNIAGPTQAHNYGNFRYEVNVHNNGPDIVHDADLLIRMFREAEEVRVTCISANAGASCPDETNINTVGVNTRTNIPLLNPGSGVQFEVTGRYGYNPPTSVNISAQVTAPIGIVDNDLDSNFAENNTSIAIQNFDIEVTDVDMSVDLHESHRTADSNSNILSEEVHYADNSRIRYEMRLTNNGPGVAKNIPWGLDIFANISSLKLTYKDLNVRCIAEGGAICPDPVPVTPNGTWSRGLWTTDIAIIYPDNALNIPFMPSAGSVRFVVEATPVKYSLGITECSDRSATLVIERVRAKSDIQNNSPRENPNTGANNTKDASKQITFGQNNIRSCGKPDIAVDFAGIEPDAVSPTMFNVPDKYWNDLNFDQNVPMVMKVTWTNSGSSVDTPMTLRAFGNVAYRTNLKYKDLSITCEASGGMTCPNVPQTNTNDFYTVFKQGNIGVQNLEHYTWGHHLISAKVPNFPSGGRITYTIRFTPVQSIIDEYTCRLYSHDTNHRDAELYWYKFNVDFLGAPVQDLNRNNHEFEVGSKSNWKRHFAYPLLKLGDHNRAECPVIDLGIKMNSSFSGVIASTHEEDRKNWVKKSIATENQEIVQEVTFENLGNHHANNSEIKLNFYGLKDAGRGSSFSFEVENASIECRGEGGAVCPDISGGHNYTVLKKGSGILSVLDHAWYSNVLSQRVSQWPAGGKLHYTIRYTPKKLYKNYDSCSLHPEIITRPRVMLSGEVNASANQLDNNYSNNKIISNQAVEFGNIEQIACVATDLSVQVKNSHKEVEFDSEMTRMVTFSNNGQNEIRDAQVTDYSRGGSGIESVELMYENYSIECSVQNGAICPSPDNFFDESISSSAIPKHPPFAQKKNQYVENGKVYFRFWNTVPTSVFYTKIPLLPPGGSVTFTIKYTPKRPLLPKNLHCSSSVLNLMGSSGTAYIGMPYGAGYSEVTTQNNTAEYMIHKMDCVDLYVTNSVESASGNEVVKPGEDVTVNISFGNRGAANARNSTFEIQIPPGLTDFDPSAVECESTNGSTCTTPEFDETKRILKGNIDLINKDGLVTLKIKGRAVSYSSSWKTRVTITEGIGFYERISDTNSAIINFVVEGTEPSIYKTTTTPRVLAGEEVDYTIFIRVPKKSPDISEVKIEDILPLGFEYVNTKSIDLLNGSTGEAGYENPRIETQDNGQKRVIWENFSIPSNGVVTLKFTARPTTQAICQKMPFHNSAKLHYNDPKGGRAMKMFDGNAVTSTSDDVMVECLPIDAVEDIQKATEDASGQGLTATTVSLLQNDAFNNTQADINLLNIEEIDTGIFFVDPAKTQLKTEIKNLFGSSIADGDILSPDLTGKTFDANAGTISWSPYAFAGKYLFGYKICEKSHPGNCDIAPVLVVIERSNRAGTINAEDDSVNITRRETDISEQKVVGILENDTFTTPDRPNDVRTANIAFVSAEFVEGPGSTYEVETSDNLGVNEFAQRKLTKITGNHPLAGAYIAETGKMYIPQNSAPAGDYDIYYKICTKPGHAQVLSVCDTAKVVVHVEVTPVAKPGTITPELDTISVTKKEDSFTPEGSVNILQNDTFTTPDAPNQPQQATKDTVTFNLRAIPGSNASGQYELDFTKRTQDRIINNQTVTQNVIATITGSHPLAGSYLTDTGEFVVPSNNIPTGKYTIYYDVCTKAIPDRIVSVCESATIVVDVHSYKLPTPPTVPELPYLNPDLTIDAQDDHVTVNREDKGTHSGATVMIFANDTFQFEGITQKETINQHATKLTVTGSDRRQNDPINEEVFVLTRVQKQSKKDKTIFEDTSDLQNAYIRDNGEFVLPEGKLENALYRVEYTICKNKLDGTEVCDSAFIFIDSKVKSTDSPAPSVRELELVATDDTLKIIRQNNEKIPEQKIAIFANDYYETLLGIKNVPNLHEVTLKIGDNTRISAGDSPRQIALKQGHALTGIMIDEKGFVILPEGNYPDGSYSVPYTICKDGKCDDAVVTITIKQDDKPMFETPMIDGQCINSLKNLDDPKLIAYYSDLRVSSDVNVHKKVTRAEFVRLILAAGKINLDNQSLDVLDEFDDVPKGAWYAKHIAYMVQVGSMQGQILSNGKKIFRPNDSITRAEASKILTELTRSAKQNLPLPKDINTFSDVLSSGSLAPYIQYAYNSCLLHGRKTINGQPLPGQPRVFEPKDGITLAETAKILYNMNHYGNVIQKNASKEVKDDAKNIASTTNDNKKNPSDETSSSTGSTSVDVVKSFTGSLENISASNSSSGNTFSTSLWTPMGTGGVLIPKAQN